MAGVRNGDGRAALGRAGERRAAWFFMLRGFRVLARNVSFHGGEIDLIVRRGRLLVFVEVKTRSENHLGNPSDAVDRGKQLRILRCAEKWMATQRLSDVEVRLDVVTLVRTRWRFRVEHIPHAFEAAFENGRPWRLV
jgi:putative endonuclease